MKRQPNRPRSNVRRGANVPSDGTGNTLKSLWHSLEHCFGKVLLSMGLLCRAGVYPSNLDCAALRAMTGTEGESAVRLFVIFPQLLKPCGAIRNFDCFPNALLWVVSPSFPKAMPLG